MLPTWNNRPFIVANILNPAFCGEILRIAIKAYKDATKDNIPFALTILILPFLLNKNTRNSLPPKTSKVFYEWIEENPIIKTKLPVQIKSLVPYTREAVLFLIYHEALKLDACGDLELKSYRKKKLHYLNDVEVNEVFTKAKMLGKWLSGVGNVSTIYATIGIKP